MVRWLGVREWKVGRETVEEPTDGCWQCTCGQYPCLHVAEVIVAKQQPPSPREPMFEVSQPLPEWVRDIRHGQWEALQWLLDRPEKVLIVDAPTGSGKTLLAELFRRVLKTRMVYACVTKGLQDQFLVDFSYARVLKGRSNYPTQLFPDEFQAGRYISAADCDKTKDDETGKYICSYCLSPEQCPYEIAKKQALGAPVAVINLAYLLAEANFVGGFSKQDLIVIDEADELEQILMGFCEVRIPARLIRQLDLGKPEFVTKPESWREWLNDRVRPRLAQEINVRSQDTSLDGIRYRKGLERLMSEIIRIADSKDLADNWVMVYGTKDRFEVEPVIFKPIRVTEYGQELVWKHAKKWLVMSATIISPDVFAGDLGLQPGEWAYLSLDSTFPVENRPIYVTPATRITHKSREANEPALVAAIDRLLERYPDERGIIHTVSYSLANRIVQLSKHQDRLITYTNTQESSEALERLAKTPNGVLVAPSMERGIDLADDLCRFCAIAKVPYPSLADKQVVARLHAKGGQAWYTVQTVRSIVQMTGRGVRHAQDRCDSYILDGQFMELRRRAWNLFPRWWREAVIWHDKLNAPNKIKGVASNG